MVKTKLILKRTQKNKQDKIKRTLNWLKPTTPAKGMLLFALVFGIAGGGYALKESLAASYTRRFPAFSMQYARKGHCHMEYTGGNYLGVAIVKARVKSDYAGKRCRVAVVVHTAPLKYNVKTLNWGGTSWSPYIEAGMGPIAYISEGYAAVVNLETNNYDEYRFTVY